MALSLVLPCTTVEPCHAAWLDVLPRRTCPHSREASTMQRSREHFAATYPLQSGGTQLVEICGPALRRLGPFGTDEACRQTAARVLPRLRLVRLPVQAAEPDAQAVRILANAEAMCEVSRRCMLKLPEDPEPPARASRRARCGAQRSVLALAMARSGHAHDPAASAASAESAAGRAFPPCRGGAGIGRRATSPAARRIAP